MKRILTALLCVMLCALLTAPGCTDMRNRNPQVTILLDETRSSGIGGTIRMELFPDKAPNSVNFVLDLIERGYYDDFTVSRVEADSMVVFGDPIYFKKQDRSIDGEFAANGFTGNDVPFRRGTVGLTLFEDDYNSNYGDFFILLDDAGGEALDGKFCAIGQITEGLEILDAISRLNAMGGGHQPYLSVATKTVTVDLRGRTYDKPITHERSYESRPGYWDIEEGSTNE